MRYAQGQPWAVEDLNLEVTQGETLTLLGPQRLRQDIRIAPDCGI